VSRPLILLDPWPRTAAMIFSPAERVRLASLGSVVGLDDEAVSGRMDATRVEAALPEAQLIIGQTDLPAERLARAAKLRAIINVEGNFLQNIDYAACFARGIQVLGIGPAFAPAVAEMALGMALDLARGITLNDRLMRRGAELYGFRGNAESFLLSGSRIGLVGCGTLGRALIPLLAPFRPDLRIHDPWLPDGAVRDLGGEPATLDEILAGCRVIFVLAGVTSENAGFISREKLQLIAPDAVFLLMSRAAVVDFEALLDCVAAGRFRAATDVFPVEPAPPDARARRIEGLLLSPHRAGGIPEAFARLGAMVIDDAGLILRGLPPQRLQAARPETVGRMKSFPGHAPPASTGGQ
jgi:phosphoglycerate dehydrogenase-like enzyme